jgi:hypothetical protein
MIIFVPKDRTGSPWGSSMIDKQGQFRLEAWTGMNEVAPGRYDIFFAFPDPAAINATASDSRFDREKDEAAPAPPQEPAPPQLPDKYTKLDTSGLWVEIVKEPRRVKIDLRG